MFAQPCTYNYCQRNHLSSPCHRPKGDNTGRAAPSTVTPGPGGVAAAPPRPAAVVAAGDALPGGAAGTGELSSVCSSLLSVGDSGRQYICSVVLSTRANVWKKSARNDSRCTWLSGSFLLSGYTSAMMSSC